MKTEWIAAIENFYDIRIINSMIGPQQFIAKTFILTNDENLKFFCKVISHPLLISNVINTLPVVAEMVKNGINFISCPVRGKEGYHFLLEDKLFVLYNYLDVHQGFDYNPFALGSKIAMIHAVSKNVETKPPIETFDFPNETLFMNRFEENLITQSSDPVIQALKALLQEHETQNRYYISELKKYGSRCKEEQPELVITHGDIATNILVKSPNEFYIVYWDEMRYAPRERDLWMREELKGFMEGYRADCPDFRLNHDCRCFCILQYYFERMNLHFSDILNESLNHDFRLARVKKLAEGKMAGWNLPKVESTSAAKTNREKMLKWASNVLNTQENALKSRVLVKTPWSIVIKIENDQDFYYLKQTPPGLYIETEIIDVIRKNIQNVPIPKIIFKNRELNCFLMNSGGDYSLRTKFNGVIDEKLLIDGLNLYIKIQRSLEKHIDDFLSIGVPDWRIFRIPDLFVELLEKKDLLFNEGLTRDEIDQLKKLVPSLQSICQFISDKKINDTLVNCDFNENNMIINESTQRISIIDWGECVISHPFFKLADHLKNNARRYKLDLNGPLLESIKQQCLSCWLDVVNGNELTKIYQNVLRLLPIFSALGIHRLQVATNNTSKEKQRWFIGAELQTLLKNERGR